MEKVLKLYFSDGDRKNVPFPSKDNQIEIYDFTASAQRMSGAPTISASVMFPQCLDKVWTETVYTIFRGEKYFLKNTPTSSKNLDDARYKHDLEFVSERVILENVYFYDVVSNNPQDPDDRPVSNSADVFFFGSVKDFAKRLNSSLVYAKIGKTPENPNGYEVVVDVDDITGEEKLMHFENQFFANVLQEIYNTFKVPYYFEGKTIHIGKHAKNDSLENIVFKYGAENNLLSITKTNANNKIINRIAAEGSSENIPYYYPNKYRQGVLGLSYDLPANSCTIANERLFYEKIELNDEFIYRDVEQNDQSVIFEDQKEYRALNELSILENGKPVRRKATILQTAAIGMLPKTRIITIGASGSSVAELAKNVAIVKLGVYKKNSSDAVWSKEWRRELEGPDLIVNETFDVDIPWSGDFEISTQCKYYPIFYKAGDEFVMYEKPVENFIKVKMSYGMWFKGNERANLEEYGIRVNADKLLSGNHINVIQSSYVKPAKRLMPPIYWETGGAERFYNAINFKYKETDGNKGTFLFDNGSPILFQNGVSILYDSSKYYTFDTIYNGTNPREHLEMFDDIKPSIKGIKNAPENISGKIRQFRIDTFADIMFDRYDNNKKVQKGDKLEYEHPYFFVKLHKTDGEYAFNLFDCAIEGQPMLVNITSGVCGGHVFEIAVDEETHKYNTVQVDKGTNIPLTDEDGDVICGREGKPKVTEFQPWQQNTIEREVWIALKKDTTSNQNQVMPLKNVFQPRTQRDVGDNENLKADTFVLTNIKLPYAYIAAAEDRLEKAAIKYLHENNFEKFNFSINFSRVYLANHPDVMKAISENSKIEIEYDGINYSLYANSYTYRMQGNEVLPEITIELKDSVMVYKNIIQNALSEIKKDVILQLSDIDIVGMCRDHFISKEYDDIANGTITFDKVQKLDGGAYFGKFKQGQNGSMIDPHGNAEFGNIFVRNSLVAMEYIINRVSAFEGDQFFTETDTIEEIEILGAGVYKLKLKSKWNGYMTGQEEGNVVKGVINNLSRGGSYYTSWMRVNTVETATNVITVTMYPDSDVPYGKNFPPCELMTIARWGNQNPTENKGLRRRSIYISNMEERMAFLREVSSPKLLDSNYSLVLGRLPDIKPIRNVGKVGEVGLYAETVLCEKLMRVDYAGNLVRTLVERGEWKKETALNMKTAYRYTDYEQDIVYHYGIRWACVKDKTVEEPKWNSIQWAAMDDMGRVMIMFDSSQQFNFNILYVDTYVTARAFYGNEEITDRLVNSPSFSISWYRKSGNTNEDNLWNSSHSSLKTNVVHITKEDMGSSWGVTNFNVIFGCEISATDGNKVLNVKSYNI